MNRLRLHDEVTIVSTLTGSARPADLTVRAHVYWVSGAAPYERNRPGLLVDALRVIVGPLPRELNPTSDRVMHHGIEYNIDGRPMVRYRRGKVHHLTINLERTTG